MSSWTIMIALATSATAVQTVTLVDQECRSLRGDASGAKGAVVSESIALSGGEKPFRCERKTGTTFHCVSTRSGRETEMTLTQADQRRLTLEQRGGSPGLDHAAVVVVDVKAGRFQVASTRRVDETGLAAEVCAGRAAVDWRAP